MSNALANESLEFVNFCWDDDDCDGDGISIGNWIWINDDGKGEGFVHLFIYSN